MAITPLLKVDNLSIGFDNDDGLVRVVEDVSFTLERGQTLSLVGESGCGKSLTAFALLQLLPPFGKILSGSVCLQGENLASMDEAQLQKIRGNRISMIFQEPMSALNPVFPVGVQVAEALILHKGMAKKAALKEAVGMLEKVGIPDPASRAVNYPHQLSGGMRQRVMIAIALACEPEILIADEPTTALDVTIQAQILDLMHDLQENLGTAILFISHDFGVVSRMADDIAVMYAGRVIEQGSSSDILLNPQHPYTQALLQTTPRIDASLDRLPAIAGRVPGPRRRPPGCCFAPRCSVAVDCCSKQRPERLALSKSHIAACHVLDSSKQEVSHAHG
ncbi:ABC transporter ATP-binding protein [Porticoccus sp. W117]|uniref:ABC transporter ATP-binding protein n=1 Tax=Porticoccus sp. W117 TaxID=3054777 RepID=UPI002591CDBF|nr:ABC transporter ATP-binding protein [Porticoccus sp. W117]MDM3871040.1 ABC transporter ATP-binding protein [Porticoccus sp. W117]